MSKNGNDFIFIMVNKIYLNIRNYKNNYIIINTSLMASGDTHLMIKQLQIKMEI